MRPTACDKPMVIPPELRTFSAQYLADHENEVLWVVPPKCGQTSVRLTLGADMESPVTVKDAAMMAGPLQWTVVMVCRDPYKRFMSAFDNKFNKLSVEHVFRTVLSHTDLALDIHLQSQSYLLDLIGVTWPDLYVRVGPDMQKDFDKALLAGGALPRELRRENISEGMRTASIFNTLPYEKLLAFQHRYARDFELWGEAHIGCAEQHKT